MSGLSQFAVTIRPQPGCLASVEAARAMGLEMLGQPLSEILKTEWQAPDAAGFDALLIGSANAIRFGGAALAGLINLPVHGVGEATAQAARDAGFVVTRVGKGGLQGLLDSGLDGLGDGSDKRPLRYLRLAGAEHIALNVPDHVMISTQILYENSPLSMPVSLAQKLKNGGVVLLHSAASARHFVTECERLGLDRSIISCVSLGCRIEKALGKGWAQSRVAERPDEASILALAYQICHEPPYK